MPYYNYRRNRGGYYKRNYRRRYRPKRKPYKKPVRYQVADFAYNAWKGVNYIKGLVNSELLEYTVDTSNNPTTNGSIVSLVAIAQGDDVSGRTGNSIFVKKILLRGYVTQNASATNTLCRIIIFMDKQQVADTIASVTDVLTTSTMDSLLNVNNFGRFTILMDKVYAMSSANGNIRPFTNTIKFAKGVHVRYNGSATTDIQKNGIYIMFISTESTNTPTIQWNSRTFYHDN